MSGKGKIEAGKIEQCDDDVKTSVGKSREERLRMFMDTYSENFKRLYDDEADCVGRDGSRPTTFYDYASHELDMIETGVYCPPEIPADEEYVADLEDCSLRAIEHYNREHETSFGNVHVLKANSEPLGPCKYYITFDTTDETNNKQTFQARVNIFSNLAKRC